MAQSLASLRAKIQTKIFDEIASTGVITRISTSTDKWGDATNTVDSSTSVSIVPFNMVATEDFQPFGDLQSGEADIILPYNTSFDVNDFIDYNDNRYIIKQLEQYPYQDGILAYAVRVAKQI